MAELTSDDNGNNEAIIDLPDLDLQQRELFKQTIGRSDIVAPAVHLLDIGQDPIRLIKTGNGGVVSYTVAIPQELQNILILDASHPVRRLIHHDKTIRNAEDLPELQRVGPLSKLKRYDQVTIHLQRDKHRTPRRRSVYGDTVLKLNLGWRPSPVANLRPLP